MGLWGWKIIPYPTHTHGDPYGDRHTHGSPGINRPQCVKSTTKFRDGPSHDLGARALAPAMQRGTVTAGYASSAGKAGLASSQRERVAAAAARFSSVDRRLDRRRRRGGATRPPPRQTDLIDVRRDGRPRQRCADAGAENLHV